MVRKGKRDAMRDCSPVQESRLLLSACDRVRRPNRVGHLSVSFLLPGARHKTLPSSGTRFACVRRAIVE